MRGRIVLFAFALAVTLCAGVTGSAVAAQAVPASEPFSGTVLTDGLDDPWEMVWGPDGWIWVTERTGKRVTRVNPADGKKKTALTISEAITGGQQGVLGMALEPGFLSEAGKNHVYVVHTYAIDGNPFMKIMRYAYDKARETLGQGVVVMEKLPAGDDHNAGRLVFGPDGKLYCSHGEQGHNQNQNYCKPIEAQRLPTKAEIDARDWSSYVGKTFRINTDGSIPADNPEINGVRSHVFTYGHRNPQGLVWANGNLYSCEHGPSTDDEVNLLVAGGNYGWPHIAGYRDDMAYVYANWSAAPECASLPFDANTIAPGVPVQKETDWKGEFVPPLRTFHTVPTGYEFLDARCKEMPYLCWPTIAPSSIAYYPKDGPITAWRNSLLVSTLKSGALYRLPMSDDGKYAQGDEAKYFRTTNRYRVVMVSPDGKSVYMATDSGGNALDEAGKPTQKMANPGAILVFTYTGS